MLDIPRPDPLILTLVLGVLGVALTWVGESIKYRRPDLHYVFALVGLTCTVFGIRVATQPLVEPFFPSLYASIGYGLFQVVIGLTVYLTIHHVASPTTPSTPN